MKLFDLLQMLDKNAEIRIHNLETHEIHEGKAGSAFYWFDLEEFNKLKCYGDIKATDNIINIEVCD